MNKIYKVMYSKVKQCAVVVSEIAKSHGHNGESSSVRKHAALMAAVLIALGSLSFSTVPTVQATDSLFSNDYVGTNYKDGNGKSYTASETKNHRGAGARGEGSNTLGMNAIAGKNTVTIGDRDASASQESVYIGSKYDADNQVHPSSGTKVVSVGYGSDAAGTGSIAIGSGAAADAFDNAGKGTNPDAGSQSIAIGKNAVAKQNNIAIGANSMATATASNNVSEFTGQEASKSYVSVGDGKKDSPTQYRRITNVADGAADSDVATIGQLKALSDKARVYNEGWGIKIADEKDDNGNVTKKNAISVDRNLGTNLDTTGHVHLDVSKTGLVLGTVVDGAPGTDVDLHYGATGDYAVTVGGGANTASGKASVVIGGSVNTASDEAAVSSGGSSNVASGSFASVYGGYDNEASGTYASIFAGAQNKASNMWTTVGGGALNEASGTYASIWGGYGNKATDEFASVYGGVANSAYGPYSAILGGGSNKAGGAAVVSGGASNEAAGVESAVLGGVGNIVTGANATAVGGAKGSVNGVGSVGILGGSTGINAPFTLAAGYQSTVTDTGVTSTPITEEEAEKFQEEGTHPGLLVGSNDPNNLSFKILDHFATAVGYQATADEAQTVAFGHDKGDTYYGTTTYKWKQKATVKDGHYYDEYGSEIKEDSYKSLMNADGTWNDYSQPIATVEKKEYDSAYYNRLVKAADGIEDHDAVVMEQLKNASGVGSKIKVYQTDENGNVQFDKNNNPIEDTSAEAETKKTAAQKASEDAWGTAIGTGKVVDPNAKDKDSNGSGQLVTGGTVYNALQQQKTDLTDALTVKPGWGIEKTKNNTISVKHNLSTGDSAHAAVAYADSEATGLILGGSIKDRNADEKYGATTKTSVIVGARNALASNDNTVVIGGDWNIASGESTTVVGGLSNTASGQGYSEAASVFGGSFNIANGLCSVVLGGIENVTNNDYSTNSGGVRNVVFGSGSINSGGLKNVVYASNASSFGGVAAAVNGEYSTGIAGGSTARNAQLSFAAGFQSVVTDSGVRKTVITRDEYERKWSEQTRELGPVQARYNPITNKYEQYDKISTALGYQATADEPGTIAFGHDAGDESGYTYEWETLTDENGNPKKNDIDYTTNDYTKPPKSVKKKDPYTSSYYNRLVKVADGVEDHDVVVMEQLKNASDVGNNIKVYKTDENGNVQFDENNKPIEDTSDAAKTKQKDSKDAWGKALGAGTFTTGTDTTPTNASTSYQLVTGKTLYDYDKPTGSQNYVNVNSTTGQNLSALDTQVKANTDALTKPNHNIKYYAVDETTLPKLTNFNGKDYSNEKNNGAKGMGSIAAGFNTHADGIASTVAGSYSGVINQNSAGLYDLRGATALSYGTFNINQNTDTGKIFSGVANSIVGQANATTDSNAAIIYGAGNTVTNSYRKIDDTNASEIMKAALSKDVKKLDEALQKAVPTSGGQVMVMGGGNNVESAYMTQVVGVGNTVKGNQVQNDKSEWVTDKSIKDYNPERSSQYNYVDGFSNEVINGKHDYVIGANNTVTGDSYDDKDAKKYSNESNIIFGDNHTVTNTKNAVIIGSSDTQMTLDKGDRATAIGHNASAQRDALAVGVNTEARGNAVALGTSSTAHNNSIAIGTKATAVSSQNLAIGWEAHIGNIKTDDEKIKNAIALGSDSQVRVNDLLESDHDRGVLSIGDTKKERRIIHVRAGVNDTDAVNVSQLKSLQSGLTENLTGKGLKFAANSGAEYTAKLGTTVTIQGTKKKENHEYTAENLTTEIDGSGNITILMDKDMSVEKLDVNGKDGKDGQPGTPGSIGIKGQDGKAGIGIDGKNGISIKGQNGTDGVTIKGIDGVNGVDGAEGHIGLNGKDGMTDIFTTAGKPGLNGKDGETMTRIVYKDPKGIEHEAATLDDGLKFKGDDDTVIAKKLNNTMEIIGGAKGDLTEGNIGVKSTTEGKLKVQLSKDLTGMNSTTYITKTGEEDSSTTSTTVVNGNGLTITNGPSITNKGVDGGNKVITNVGSGIEKGGDGKYTVTKDNTSNAANIGDVDNMVNQAVKGLSDATDTKLADKANVNASNIGANISSDTDKQKANEEAWGDALGKGEIKADEKRLVTGDTVAKAIGDEKTAREAADQAINEKIGTLDKDGNYIKKDDSISKNLSTLDGHVKNNADAISKISRDVSNLSDNAVQYDKDTNKSKVTLAGEDGTTIDKVKDGTLTENGKEAVNGGQLWKVDQKVENNTTEINKIKNGDFTDASKTAIHNIAKNAVEVVDGTNTKAVKIEEGTDTTPTKYAVNVEGTGKVASGDTGLISGGTLYKEVHVDKDGTYIKSKDSATDKDMTVAQNLFALDKGLKTTSDLIHTNTAVDTIQIGENSTATKIDVSGKDANGNTTGRVITGVVTDDGDPTSAANVGYVNGVTAANTQQIYRDMNNAYGRLNNNINKAAAGSNALAALHPLDYDSDDKADFAVGYGHYRNANAAAVGAFYHPNENTMVNVGVSLGNGDPGFNAGVSFKIGSGSAGRQAMSKTEMAKVINSQSKEIDALKKDNADKDKRIDALEQKMAEILAKLDKNGK